MLGQVTRILMNLNLDLYTVKEQVVRAAVNDKIKRQLTLLAWNRDLS